MSAGTKPGVSTVCRPFSFEGLPRYERDEVALSNWSRRFLPDASKWKLWIQEGWGELLLVFSGLEITLTQKHSVDALQEPVKHVFREREILIGRDPGNQVVLPTRSVGKHHARLFVEGGRCSIEDLGSPLGTYLNQDRLLANQPHAIKAGDQFAIFPHVFAVGLRQLWSRHTDISVYGGGVEAMTWRTFLGASTSTRTSFPILVHPTGAALLLEISRPFLAELMERVLRPLALEGPPAAVHSAPGEGILEFVTLCLVERVNREIAFPFQFEAGPCGTKPEFADDARGLALTCSLNLQGTTGAFRVFLPFASLEAMRRAAPEPVSISAAPSLSWKFPVSVGHAELTSRDILDLERHDVLLFEPGFRLLVPGRPGRGWRLSPPEDIKQNAAAMLEPRNSWRMRIDNYEERGLLKSEPESGEQGVRQGKLDAGQLPVQVHVILAEKELTLAEANGLVTGTILELDCDAASPVSLAVNGKIVGEGQLVDVEGRLGVKILAWKAA